MEHRVALLNYNTDLAHYFGVPLEEFYIFWGSLTPAEKTYFRLADLGW